MIQRLSLLTEIPYETIYELTLRSYEKTIFEQSNTTNKQKWVLPLGIYHRTWTNNGLQFCPVCLSKDEEPYFRKSWRLGLSVACTKCNTLLHDCCPNCNSPVTFFRSDVGFKYTVSANTIATCWQCGFDIRNSFRYPTVIGTIGYQTKINTIIKTKHWQDRCPSNEYFDALYQILKFLRSTSPWYRHFVELIMSYENLRIRSLPTKHEFEKFNTIEREISLRIACWILEEWPHRFINLCKESKLTTSIVLKDTQSLPPWFITVANDHLHLPSASEKSIMRMQAKKQKH